MKETITESGGLYWLQHTPPKSLLRIAIGAHRSFTDRLRDFAATFKSLFVRRIRSLAAAEERSKLVIGSAAQCISPCLQRLPRHSRRLVLLAR
jgi:hypothetical protein